MINFWPTENLDRYLDLKNRVEARMALADAAATGGDDPLDEGAAQGELKFRDEQLKRLRGEILDIEDADDGVTMSDLTLDDFLADLLQYIQKHRKALEAAPFGIYAIADGSSDSIKPGVVFCLKHKADNAERTPNLLWPYFLVHVRDDGHVRYTFQQAKPCLGLFRKLAAGRAEAATALEDAFDKDTGHGRKMEKYDQLLEAALKSIAGAFRKAQMGSLTQDPAAKLVKLSERTDSADRFELVTWLIIKNGPGPAAGGSPASA